ncbi:MAG: molybdate ABC transporter substrate-binding protein [Intrasporangium sp.]|uniref:molybdate ABC transporter substrate-binding protein n=1 Tax=Intrasporangium sp. TaxID=1925024 RepID=UPI0026483D74|nr:molybdate ABC transporter substrate-binding protein [Intrasporangium sp.]MDN5796818.1 molybdate ABC transporter substrate-binding protein [Intrasporangium sp.]
MSRRGGHRARVTRDGLQPGRRGVGGRPAAALTALVAVLLLAGCGATGSPRADASPRGGIESGSGVTGTVTVLAAASLTESFDAIAAKLERAHPGLTVEVSYGSSATLVQQVNQGAPADVVALAGEAAAKPLDPARVRSSDTFASNSLEIAVPPSNPGHVTSLTDLSGLDLKVVLCEVTVPCGKAAAATLAKATVEPHVVSREIDVKATLAKVSLGEADAAIVYHSDVVAAKGAVSGIPIPAELNTTLDYPIIRLDDEAATRVFVHAVLSPQGRATLTSLGFGPP